MAKTLLDDPRYIAFSQRYSFNLPRFATEVIGMQPTFQQFELLESANMSGSRTTVRSGHGSGKSRSIAVISLWHLVCYPKSNTMLTAPKIEQVKNIAWKEIYDCVDFIKTKGGYAWLADYIAVEAERIYIKNFKQSWFVFAKTAPRGSPENLAGMHRDWYLVIADEASGIPDANYSVMTGALTDKRNRMVLLSQPTRPSGFFYDTHNKLSKRNGGVWTSIRMDSRLSPLVSVEFLEEKKQEYTEDEYTIKVLGEFPESRDDFLLGRKAAENCINRMVIQEGEMFGYILSCDVGAGEYRDKSVAVLAKVSGFGDFGQDARRVQVVDIPILSNTRNLQDFSGAIFNIAAELENVHVLVDAGGMGIAVCQQLETLGLADITRVRWGSPCFQKKNKERFFNMRAQAMLFTARAAKDGRLGIASGYWDREFLDQASRIPFHFDEKARYVIERKDEMRKMGLPSPDIFDAVAFCFLEGVSYNLCSGESQRKTTALNLIKKVEDIFSDI